MRHDGPRSNLRRRTAATVLTVVVVGLLLISAQDSARVGESGTSLPVAPTVAGACLGSMAASTATGTLELRGTATPAPALSGVSVTVDYFYSETTTTASENYSSCVPTGATGATAGTGAFSVALPIPADRCLDGACVRYTGPYGPLGFGTAGAPAGFFEQDPSNGTSPGTIVWYADLYAASVTYPGRAVVSAGAPVALSVSTMNADGAPASVPVSYNWNIVGLGWTLSNRTHLNVTAQGLDGGWPGSITVTVDSTFGGTVESVTSPALTLWPVSTQVLTATASPTPVDPGVPVTFHLTGIGAAGYRYSAAVDPGLGAGSVSGPCIATPLPNGSANLTCTVEAAYPAAGVASPTASISNGYSSGQVAVAAVPVHPVEQVAVSAPSFVTYPNRTVDLTVSVLSGTGSGPYGPACLAVNDASDITCQFQNASAWTFPVTFPSPGEESIRGFVLDHFGENVSASAVVLVVPFLSARASGNATPTFVANRTGLLSVTVSGGALPIQTWWNLSGAPLPLCEDLVPDGTSSCVYSPTIPGTARITLTLRDALGSEAEVAFRILVTSGIPPGSGSSGTLFFTVLVDVALGVGVAAAVVVAVLVQRRRARHLRAPGREPAVAEGELERMARGREHILARADPQTPHRPDELVAEWTGPPIAPEEWAEWIAALVADGSLTPSHDDAQRLVYRRSKPRPPTTTIRFDPSVWEARQAAGVEEPDDTDRPGTSQGGG